MDVSLLDLNDKLNVKYFLLYVYYFLHDVTNKSRGGRSRPGNFTQ